MLKNTQFSEDFYEKLPKKPYCSFGKGGRTLIRSKKHAVQYPLIQVNPPHLVNYLVFDIDQSDAYFAWFDAGLPPPTWIAKNPKNGHCHICYELKTAVCKTANAHLKPLRYLASIEYTYAKKLGADLGYVGLLTKNPVDRDWQVYHINQRPFELDELADYVDLENKPKQEVKEISGLGRNCALFDEVRFWAYKAIRAHLKGGYDLWYAEVLKVAINANEAFLDPLGYSEVKATAKSVARWVWRNHGSAEFQAQFSAKQARKGKAGAAAANAVGACSTGGKARSATYSDLRQEALKLHVMGFNPTQIAKKLNISRPSVYKWVKNCPKV